MPIDLPVRLAQGPLTPICGRIRDLSLSGAYIETGPHRMSAGALLVEFDGDCFGSGGSYTLRAYVVRRVEAGVGVEWCEFAPESIRDLLACACQFDNPGKGAIDDVTLAAEAPRDPLVLRAHSVARQACAG